MIDHLITALSKEVEMSAEEIADTIWLALQMQEFQAESVSSGLPLNKEDERGINKQESQSEQGTLPKTSELGETPTPSPEERKAGIYPRHQQHTSKSLDLSFKVPDAPSLREPLTLARALKPLMRCIPSGRELVLDEAATIQRIADEGLWIPVLKPTVEPWLDLELVVDEAISMQIWRHTIRELERLLKNYGIFRDVRVWGLITDENEQVQIRRGIGATAKNQTLRSPKELIDLSGRRLVLVVSDCVSSLWRNGGVTPVLELWAKQGSMAIVQMLPKWLWKRTALGRASEVRLRGLTPGVSNQKLIAKEVSLWDELEEETGVKVPVFTLQPDKVATWAQMLSGKGSIWTSGYVFKLDATPVKKESSLFNLTHSNLSAEQRVQAFRVTASPVARKLAGLLASAPMISLPIVRLIRETLLKDSQQVHVAEVFLGGLLKPLSEINADTNPDYVQYEFMEGLRELLVDSVPSKYVLNVVDKVSKYVAKKAGLSLEDFAAVLRNPQQVRDSQIADDVAAFATVTAQVLRRLGGEYVQFAEDLEKSHIKTSDKGQSETEKLTLKEILHRVENEQQTDEDITFLRQQLLAGDRQLSIQLGKYNVNIGEGKEIHIGDRIYKQWDEHWRCIANLTEIDYTHFESQSTGIRIIDELAHNLTNFSQQNVTRYGLKLAFSPNHHQEYLISGGNQVIKLWQTKTREILQEISVPSSATGIFDLWFTSVAISPDGQLIAACKAYQINIWRLGTSNVLHTFGKTLFSNFLDIFGFDSVAFSLDGKVLAANDNQDIKLWDVESGEEITKLSGHSDKVTCVAFNPKNGQILASCSYDKTIKLWDIDSKRCLGTLSAHRDAVYTLAFSPDGKILASGSNDNTIKLWRLNTGETPQTLQQHSDGITCLVFSPDGATLVSGSNDETIVEWKITENELQVFPERHRRGVTSIAFSPDGNTLISGGRDQTIKVWRPLFKLQKEENLAKILNEIIPENKEIFESVIEEGIINLLVHKTVNSPEIPDDNNEGSIIIVGQPYNITLEPECTEDNKDTLFLINFTLTVECQLLYYIFKADYYTLNTARLRENRWWNKE